MDLETKIIAENEEWRQRKRGKDRGRQKIRDRDTERERGGGIAREK